MVGTLYANTCTSLAPIQMFLMYTEAARAKEMARAQKSGSKRSTRVGTRSSEAPSVDAAVIVGPTESSVNPMFLSKSGDGSAANPLLSGGQVARDAVMSLTSPPPPELWSVFQSQFLSLSEQVRSAFLCKCVNWRTCRGGTFDVSAIPVQC